MATSYVCQIGKGVEKVLFSDQFLSVGTFRLLRAIVEKVFFLWHFDLHAISLCTVTWRIACLCRQHIISVCSLMNDIACFRLSFVMSSYYVNIVLFRLNFGLEF